MNNFRFRQKIIRKKKKDRDVPEAQQIRVAAKGVVTERLDKRPTREGIFMPQPLAEGVTL
jgi:hypothetical protein